MVRFKQFSGSPDKDIRETAGIFREDPVEDAEHPVFKPTDLANKFKAESGESLQPENRLRGKLGFRGSSQTQQIGKK